MLENLKPIKRDYPCRVRTELDRLDDADRKILTAALEDEKRWSSRGLANQLKTVAGIIISDTAIARHRKKLCSCEFE